MAANVFCTNDLGIPLLIGCALRHPPGINPDAALEEYLKDRDNLQAGVSSQLKKVSGTLRTSKKRSIPCVVGKVPDTFFN